MRQFINIVEEANSPNTITVYHGDEREHVELHPGMFFSTDPDFCTSYGPHITKWSLDTLKIVDSLDDDLVEEILARYMLYDGHSDRDIETVDDYMELSSDTWEMIEPHAQSICKLVGAAGMTIYEGGVQNYVIYDTSVLTPA
jgi:hypothetical protein